VGVDTSKRRLPKVLADFLGLLFDVLPQKPVNIKAKLSALTQEQLCPAHVAGDALQVVGGIAMDVLFYWDQISARNLRIASFVNEDFLEQELQAERRAVKRKHLETLQQGVAPSEIDTGAYAEIFNEEWISTEPVKLAYRRSLERGSVLSLDTPSPTILRSPSGAPVPLQVAFSAEAASSIVVPAMPCYVFGAHGWQIHPLLAACWCVCVSENPTVGMRSMRRVFIRIATMLFAQKWVMSKKDLAVGKTSEEEKKLESEDEEFIPADASSDEPPRRFPPISQWRQILREGKHVHDP
jgi:hypothetical protein